MKAIDKFRKTGIIELTFPEILRTEGIAKERRKQGIRLGDYGNRKKIGKRDQFIQDCEGLRGEYALQLYTGVLTPMNMQERWDHMVGAKNRAIDGFVNGWSYDVKHTSYRGGHLIVPSAARKKSQIFILTTEPTGFNHIIKITGWVTRKEFKEKHIMKVFKEENGPQPCMPQYDLHQIKDLPERVKNEKTLGEISVLD